MSLLYTFFRALGNALSKTFLSYLMAPITVLTGVGRWADVAINVRCPDLMYNKIQYVLSSAVCVRHFITQWHTCAIRSGVPSRFGARGK